MAAAPSAVRANILIDPTGGTNFVSSFASNGVANPDDGSALRSLGGTFNFYGYTLTSIFVQADGFLSSADGQGYLVDRSIGALATVIGGKVIAPLYDDLYVDATFATVTDKSVAEKYYEVTYANVNGYTDTTVANSSTFQTALFFGNTTLAGFNFQAGDIALSYGALNSTIQSSTATVGIASNGTTFTPLKGTTDGQITNFSTLPTGSNFVLFRTTDGGVSYTVSIVPEPSSLALSGLAGIAGVAGLAIARSRRQPVGV